MTAENRVGLLTRVVKKEKITPDNIVRATVATICLLVAFQYEISPVVALREMGRHLQTTTAFIGVWRDLNRNGWPDTSPGGGPEFWIPGIEVCVQQPVENEPVCNQTGKTGRARFDGLTPDEEFRATIRRPPWMISTTPESFTSIPEGDWLRFGLDTNSVSLPIIENASQR